MLNPEAFACLEIALLGSFGAPSLLCITALVDSYEFIYGSILFDNVIIQLDLDFEQFFFPLIKLV